jgi:uncharacterized YccA/Bax inhibitor family protein
MVTQKQAERREIAAYLGVTALFITGMTMAIVGGLTAATATFGAGLGICISLVVIGLIIRERNISS